MRTLALVGKALRGDRYRVPAVWAMNCLQVQTGPNRDKQGILLRYAVLGLDSSTA